MEFSNFQTQIKKKVFFKPEFSSELKYSPIIAPQFINQTTLTYMSGHQFMTYSIEDESFTMTHRPFKSYNEKATNETELVNVQFAKQEKNQISQTFYITKSLQNQIQTYYLGRKQASFNRDHQSKILCRGAKLKSDKKQQKKFSIFNESVKKQKQLKKIPEGIISFGSQLIANYELNIIICRAVKQVILKKKVTFEQQPDQQDQSDLQNKISKFNSQEERSKDRNNQSINDESFDSQYQEKKSSQKTEQKSGLLLYSLNKDQSSFWSYKDNILQIKELKYNRYLLFTLNQLLLVQFEVHSNFQNFSFQKNSYQENTYVEVKIIDQYTLPYFQKVEEDVCNKIKKGVTANFIPGDKNKRGHSNSVVFQNLQKQLWKKEISKQSRTSLKQSLINKFSNAQLNKNSLKFWKQTKKVIQIFKLNQGQGEYIMLLHCLQKTFLNASQLQSQSKQYFFSLLNIEDGCIYEIDHQQQICSNQTLINGSLATYINQTQNQQLLEKNMMSFVKQINGITTKGNLILIWEKNQSTIHYISFKVLIKTTQMLDVSDPANLKTQKTINFQKTLILEYRNKINLQINSNIIKNIIISPNCKHFLLMVGSSRHAKLSEVGTTSQIQMKEQRLDHIDQNYDISEYLLFQYDLFTQLWTNDPSVYLKIIPNVYQKRKVVNIIPFKTKNQIIIQSGNKIHELHKFILQGALSFDIHPYGFFLAVSFGFTAKIYSLQHSTINLIYTYNAQAIKKICYSPCGNDLIIMSSKHIKVLDSCSFAIKHIISQKSANCSFTYLSFSANGSKMYCVYDHIFVNIHNTDSYQKSSYLKPSQNSILRTSDKIVSIAGSQEDNCIMILLQNGKLYTRLNQNVISIKLEQIYKYEDDQKIMCIHYDAKKKILFCGLKNGMVRAHIWPMPSEIQAFNNYSQFKFGYSQITVLRTSFLSYTLYTGDVNGNVGVVSYVVQKDRKITGQIRPDNFLINNVHNTFLSNIKNQAQAVQKNYKFCLTSASISLDECPQKLKLEYKLNQIITRMNDQMKKFKSLMKERLGQKESLAKNKINFSKLYNQSSQRLAQITRKIKELKETQHLEKNRQIQEYEKEFKNIIDEQNQLIKARGLELSKNIMAKSFLKCFHQKDIQNFQQQVKIKEGLTDNQGHKGISLMLQTQKLVPYEQIDELPHWIIGTKQQYLKQLTRELQKQQQKCFELKKKCTYMQSSKNNLQMAKIKEETIQFRIDIELKEMQNKLNFQKKVHGELVQEVRQTQSKIQKLQEKAIQRNPDFSRNSSQEGDDGCLYKIWIKDRYNEELTLLSNHLANLNQIMEKKRQDIVQIVSWKKKVEETCSLNEKHKNQLKKYLANLRKQLLSIKGNLQNQYCKAYKYDALKKNRKLQTKNIKLTQKILTSDQFYRPQISLQNSKVTTRRHKLIKTNQLSKRISKQKILKQSDRKKSPQESTMNSGGFFQSSNLFNGNDQLQRILQKRQRLDHIEGQNYPQHSEQMENNSFKQNKSQSKLIFLKTIQNNLQMNVKHQQNNQVSFTSRVINELSRKKQQKNSEKKYIQKQKLIPFSATSSPQMKQINYSTNLLEKKTKFFKNMLKIDQRKIKRINGENGDLLTQFEQLKVENKQMEQQKSLFVQNINMVKGLFEQSQQDFQIIKLNHPTNEKKVLTPFQKYIKDKSEKKFKNLQKLKQNKQPSVTSSKFYKTAVSSPNFTQRISKKICF